MTWNLVWIHFSIIFISKNTALLTWIFSSPKRIGQTLKILQFFEFFGNFRPFFDSNFFKNVQIDLKLGMNVIQIYSHLRKYRLFHLMLQIGRKNSSKFEKLPFFHFSGNFRPFFDSNFLKNGLIDLKFGMNAVQM